MASTAAEPSTGPVSNAAHGRRPHGWRRSDEEALYQPMAMTVRVYRTAYAIMWFVLGALLIVMWLCLRDASHGLESTADAAANVRARWEVQVIVPLCLAVFAYFGQGQYRTWWLLRSLASPGFAFRAIRGSAEGQGVQTATRRLPMSWKVHARSRGEQLWFQSPQAVADLQLGARALEGLAGVSEGGLQGRPDPLVDAALTWSTVHVHSVTLVTQYADRLGNNVFQYVMGRLRAHLLCVGFHAPRLGAPFDDVVTTQAQPDQDLRPLPPGLIDGARSAMTPEAIDAVLRSSPAWRVYWHAVLLHPAAVHIMNTSLMAGHEPQIKAWLLPSLERHIAAARGAASVSTGAESIAAGSQLHAAAPRRRRPSESQQHAARVPRAPVAIVLPPEASLEHSDEPHVDGWGPCDVAIHVRLGDILWGHHAAYRPLPMSFYRRALLAIALQLQQQQQSSTVGIHRVIVVTEDRTHEIIVRMGAWLLKTGLARRVVLQSSTLPGDFVTLTTAPNLIMSISSMAWWAAFCGSARNIVFPRYGLFQRQVWQPDAGVVAIHNLTLRDGEWQAAAARDAAEAYAAAMIGRHGRTVAAPSSASDASHWHLAAVLAAHEGVRHERVQSWDGSLQASLSDYAIPADTHGTHRASSRPESALHRALADVCAEYQDKAAACSPRVIELEAILSQYDGDFRHTMEALFDDVVPG